MKTPTTQEAVAANIRVLLAARNVSRANLAYLLGWSESSLYRRLTGRSPITLDDLDLIAATLSVSHDTLLDRTAVTR